MPKLMRRLGQGLSDIAEPLYVIAAIPLFLAAGWVALAAAPVASAWIKRLQPPKEGGGGSKAEEERPRETGFTVVLNPSLGGGNTKANQNLAGMVAWYLSQGANRVPVVNLGSVQGYYTRLQRISDLTQAGKKPLVITLASAPLQARLRGAVVAGVAQDIPNPTPRAKEVAAESLSIAQTLGQRVRQAYRDGGRDRAFAGTVDLWKEPTLFGNPNGIPPVDIYFHKTLSDGIDHGGIRLDAFRPDRPAILGPRGGPIAVHNVWLNYMDAGVDKEDLERLATAPHFGLAERIAGMLANGIRLVMGVVGVPSLPPAPQ